MINIRHNVFETNSSSTHSLVVVGGQFGRALIAAYPELKDTFEFLSKNPNYTWEEMYNSLEAIGAKLENGVLDLTDVDEEEYDFGYVYETIYADFAHKLLLALTIRDDPYHNDYENYFKNSLETTLLEFGIHSVVPPKGGFTGIDHQSAEDLEYAVKYDLYRFLTRKDYVLVLDHD
jgi:hypothetical protein